MNNYEIEQIVKEIEQALIGHRFGRIFPLSRLSMAIDFRRSGGSFLFISVEPGAPRAYLIRRRLRDLEKQPINPTPFLLGLRKRLSGAELRSVSQLRGERVLIFKFLKENETGESEDAALVVQLTGRSANMFVLDGQGVILDRLRDTVGDGQEIATCYLPPTTSGSARRMPIERPTVASVGGQTLSEKFDKYYIEKETEDQFHSRAEAERKKLRSEIAKKTKLDAKLYHDLKTHGNAERWKRFGDLLLANAANAKRKGDNIVVTDFYDEATPEIEIEGEGNLSITEIAEKYFKRYTKARNAAEEIARRRSALETEITRLEMENERLENAIAERDESYFSAEHELAKNGPNIRKQKKSDFSGARRFTSSDGYEILVGKKAKDNDYLTFRIAKSLDLWLHAADYPGSHVIVQNPNRKEIPSKTLLEAAQLAAFYSDARQQPKAAVNYTQKKFVNKPRGAAPGLVRIASFKTILVVPQVPRIEKAA